MVERGEGRRGQERNDVGRQWGTDSDVERREENKEVKDYSLLVHSL
jgi:hypothetical protein